MGLNGMDVLIYVSVGQPRLVHAIAHTFCRAGTSALLVLFDLSAAW